MLSLNGFKMNLENVQHYTNLSHTHETAGFLEAVEQSKQVLEKNFIEQEKSNKDMYTMVKDFQRIRFICDRADAWSMEDSDIKEILEITKKWV